MAPFMNGVRLPQGYRHFEEVVYFLPFSSQTFLVLILSTSEGWKAESTLELLSGFENGTPGLGIQHLNHFPLYNFNSLHKSKKHLCSHKVLANFQIKSFHYNEETRERWAETMTEFLKVVRTKYSALKSIKAKLATNKLQQQ